LHHDANWNAGARDRTSLHPETFRVPKAFAHRSQDSRSSPLPESCLKESPVKVQEQVRTSGTRRVIVLLVVVVLGIGAGVFFGKFYFVRELFLFVAIAALLAFFAANLLVLGIVFQTAGRSIVQSVRNRRAKPVAEVNAERQPRPFLGSPTVGRSGGSAIHGLDRGRKTILEIHTHEHFLVREDGTK
jgi:hypothetical protein